MWNVKKEKVKAINCSCYSVGDTFMFDEKENALLQDILTELQTDEYEYGGFFTIGGPNGTYLLKTPYNTECEYSPVCISSSSGAIVAIAVNNSGITAFPNDGSLSLGKSGNSESNAFQGLVIDVGGYNGQISEATWNPLPQPGVITVVIGENASNSCYVVFAFRRKLARYIPAPPRLKPSHQHVQSRRNSRTQGQRYLQATEAGLKGE